MSDDGHCTCPQAIRARNRRTKKSNTYQTKAWKDTVAAFVKGKKCEWCGSTEKLLAHHPYRDTPDAIYQDLYLSGCIVLCNTCHFMFHRRHKRKCPVCGEHWMDLDVDRCYECHLKATPGLKEWTLEKAEQKERDRKARNADQAAKRLKSKVSHPCKFHRIGGWCGLSAIHSQCQYSKTKALKPAPIGCHEAIPKKRMVKK
jgi:hypothetical protein